MRNKPPKKGMTRQEVRVLEALKESSPNLWRSVVALAYLLKVEVKREATT